MSERRVKYGLEFRAGTLDISIELYCYRKNHTKEKGGLGAEEHFKRAFKMMWPTYEWSRWVELLIWAFCNYRWIVVMGHSRASKTFTMAHICWLDYCADPNTTLTSMGTVVLGGLRTRMWGDLMRAAETAKIKFPIQIVSTTNELKAFPSEAKGDAAEKYQIHGMALDSKSNAEGKIRGMHANRRRIFLDEAEEVSQVIYEAIDNPMTAPDAKAVFLTNPKEKISGFGKLAEPVGGWDAVTPEDLVWKLARHPNDGICIHLDGLQSPNLVTDKYHSGLLTRQNIEDIRASNGEDSVAWWTRVRGFPVPDGMVSRVFPQWTLDKGKPSIIFDFEPEPCASLDPAFEHDNCVLNFGEKGKLSDGRIAINAISSEILKLKTGEGIEPKDYQIAHLVMAKCKERGVKPKNFIMDKSGGGRGVYAILQVEWSNEVQGIEYGGAATDRPINHGGPKACDDVKYFVSELYFRARYFVDSGLLGGIGNLGKGTWEDLGIRTYETVKSTVGELKVIETKAELKKRLGHSPDEGDTFVQFGELLAREGMIPGMKDLPQPGKRWVMNLRRAVRASKAWNDDRDPVASNY